MRYFSGRRMQVGMTLIEIMIAMIIGAFLIGGVLQIFINTKQSYRLAEGQSRLQENARYALEIINNDLRMTGFQGCPSLAAVTPTNTASTPMIALTPATAITGYQGSTAATPTSTWTPALSTTLSGLTTPITPGTDVITVLYGSNCGSSYLTATMGGGTPSASGSIIIQSPTANPANTCSIAANDVLLISDCNLANANTFRATAVTSTSTTTTITHTTATNSTASLSKAYTSSAELFKYRAYSYFIRPGTSGQPALWRLDNTQASNTATNPSELIEGVENMQILYGEDTDATPDGAANYYVPANSVVSMAKVVSIRVSLLVRSIDDNLAAQPITYTYNGITTTTTSTPAVTDRRIRRVFTSTIAVRNRLP